MFRVPGAVAVVTVEETVALVPVEERGGVLVDRRDGVPVDLVSLVTILAPELLEPVPA